MTLKVRVVTIEGEAAEVAHAVAAVTAAFGGQAIALPAPAVATARAALPVARTKDAPSAPGKYDAAVLKALGFHACTLTEIAGTLCRDKREVPKMAVRLHSVLKRLQRDGQVVKRGKEYAVKGK